MKLNDVITKCDALDLVCLRIETRIQDILHKLKLIQKGIKELKEDLENE